jgi:SAM-dependent methyltransferase
VTAQARFDADRLDEFAFSSRKTPEYMHHRLVACPVCDAVYASPLPATPQTLVKAYEDAAFDSDTESRYASLTYGRLLARIKATLPDVVGAIDVGTGDGAFLEQLLAQGFTDVVGVEPSKAPIQAAKAHIRPLIRSGPFERRSNDNNRFSLVTCFQTLEHLYDPVSFCRQAYAMLKENGAILFVCHNRRAVSAKLLGTKSPIFDIEHLQLFSPTSVRYLLTQTGFSDVTITPVWNTYPISYWLKLFPFPKRLKRAAMTILQATGGGSLRVKIPAGNIAVVGYKRKEPHVAAMGRDR